MPSATPAPKSASPAASSGQRDGGRDENDKGNRGGSAYPDARAEVAQIELEPKTDEADRPRRLLLQKSPQPAGRLAVLYHPIERRLEWIAKHLKAWAVIDLIQLGSTLFVVLTAVSYLLGADGQRKAQRLARQSAAWQVINAAQGKGGSGGRIQALETLAADGVVLDGVVLTRAYLVGLRLQPRTSLAGARLDSASLTGATLDSTNLVGATLIAASLDSATLSGANLGAAALDTAYLEAAMLASADLRTATLTGATLLGATLSGANLLEATLTGANLLAADLTSATLTNANLVDATLTGAKLFNATLTGADLSGATLDDADLRLTCIASIQGWERIHGIAGAQIAGVRGAPQGFREWALARGATEFAGVPDSNDVVLRPCER